METQLERALNALETAEAACTAFEDAAAAAKTAHIYVFGGGGTNVGSRWDETDLMYLKLLQLIESQQKNNQ